MANLTRQGPLKCHTLGGIFDPRPLCHTLSRVRVYPLQILYHTETNPPNQCRISDKNIQHLIHVYVLRKSTKFYLSIHVVYRLSPTTEKGNNKRAGTLRRFTSLVK